MADFGFILNMHMRKLGHYPTLIFTGFLSIFPAFVPVSGLGADAPPDRSITALITVNDASGKPAVGAYVRVNDQVAVSIKPGVYRVVIPLAAGSSFSGFAKASLQTWEGEAYEGQSDYETLDPDEGNTVEFFIKLKSAAPDG